MTDFEIADALARAHACVRSFPDFAHEAPVHAGEAFKVLFSKSPGAQELIRQFVAEVYLIGFTDGKGSL